MSKPKPNGAGKWYHGQYIPQNPDKYTGDATDIVYRSKWEYKFCYYCDNEERIKKWSCEDIKIPYSIIENNKLRERTYTPDFWIQVKKLNGNLEDVIIEIKPQKETIEPLEPKKNSIKSLENYEYRLKTYIKNLNKWEAAEKYCNKKGMSFHILTEKYFNDKQIKLF